MQNKPSICKNTNKILNLKVKVRASAHRHAGCYFNTKEDKEVRECTHRPNINAHSEAMVAESYHKKETRPSLTARCSNRPQFEVQETQRTAKKSLPTKQASIATNFSFEKQALRQI